VRGHRARVGDHLVEGLSGNDQIEHETV
jgi:hypothetical protein